ncbi:hypothetical protein GCM10010451_39950 [Streptomyces virens]|uniref:Uncharacterized protein n=1 Tax=Streptomyces virens TaxID=285572 RepID=A0ABP6PRP9_9ACTN
MAAVRAVLAVPETVRPHLTGADTAPALGAVLGVLPRDVGDVPPRGARPAARNPRRPPRSRFERTWPSSRSWRAW